MAIYKSDIVDINLNSGTIHRSFLGRSSIVQVDGYIATGVIDLLVIQIVEIFKVFVIQILEVFILEIVLVNIVNGACDGSQHADAGERLEKILHGMSSFLAGST